MNLHDTSVLSILLFLEGGGHLFGFLLTVALAIGLVCSLVGLFRARQALRKEDQKLEGADVGFFRDATDRVDAFERLRESERRFRLLFENASLGIALVDKNGIHLEFNRQLEQFLGYSADEVNAYGMGALTHPDDRGKSWKEFEKVKEKGGAYSLEKRYLRRDGRVVWGRLHVVAVADKNGKMEYYITMIEDITSRKEAEMNLTDYSNRLRLATRAARVAMWDWDLVKEELYLSPEWKAQLGYAEDELESTFSKWVDLLHPEDRERVLAYVEVYLRGEEEEFLAEFRLRHKDGSYRWIYSAADREVDEAGRAIRVYGCHIDVTEQKELEYQLFRSQRMEGIGTLAGGIAHDLNNILTPVLLSSGGLLRRADLDPPIRKSLEIIQQSAERGASVIRQLLTFARGKPGAHEEFDLVLLLKELVKILKETFPRNIGIELDFEKDLPLIKGDPTQIHQVFLNLLVNARDAMPEGGQVTITVKAGLPADSRKNTRSGLPDAVLCIEVSDTGIGIPEEVVERIFDPFFTTKERGKGTGLGLSTASGILAAHGGKLTVRSRPGEGSTFRVLLPTVSPEREAAEVSEEKPMGRGEEVLLVDDEPAILNSAGVTLEERGYKVTCCSDGESALTAFLKRSGAFDLVVTDLNMPGMSGLELVRKLKGFYPDLEFLFISGSRDAGEVDADALLVPESILTKPFLGHELVGRVAQALERRRIQKG